MEYICHRRYQKIGASGIMYSFRQGALLETIGRYIAYKNGAVCATCSEDAYMYFARNDDGKGLKRGRLTYEIAYAPRHPNMDNGFRFTPAEMETLINNYGRFLRYDCDTIVFNKEFFNAEIEELEEIKREVMGCSR